MEWDPANIRALRTALRLPQEKFAFQLGAAPKTVRNWEQGQHPPSLALQRALDQAWESASPEQKKRFFACLPPGRKAEAWTAADSGGGEETASTSIMDSPVAPVGRSVSHPAAPAVTLDDLKRIAAALEDARRYMDLEVVAYFQRRIAACAASDGASGPKGALPVVLGIVGAVESDSRHVKSSIRSQLLAVGAQGAEFVAWLYRDLGMPEMADHWRDRAIDWAQEVGDLPMQGYVLLKKSQAAWDDRDALRMLALARAVQEGPWRVPIRVRAEALQQEARGYAMSGDLEMMERKVDEAQELLADGGGEDDQTGGAQLGAHYGPPLLAMQIAICYCEAGRPGRAVEIFRDQLTSEAFSRRDCGYFASLMASALAAAGEPGEACRVGIDALGIAIATNSMRTTREVVGVAGRLQPWRHHPPVGDLYDALAASGVALSSS